MSTANSTTADLYDAVAFLLSLPTGRRSKATQEAERAAEQVLADALIELRSTSTIAVSARGWCYLLEEYGLTKDQFDKAETVINKMRKDGRLPYDICAEDASRVAKAIERFDYPTAAEEHDWMVMRDEKHIRSYSPHSFWEDQHCYLQLGVEKVDLVTLLLPVCEAFRIPLYNAKGWPDINMRVAMLKRFEVWDDGRDLVLLYCGDHDPKGLLMSDTWHKMLMDVAVPAEWDPSDVVVDRFGLNADFIAQAELTWIDNLITGSSDSKDLADPGHREHYHAYVQDYIRQFGPRKCEANSLVVRPDAARSLLRDAIERWLPDSQDCLKEFEDDVRDSRRELWVERFGTDEGFDDDDDDE